MAKQQEKSQKGLPKRAKSQARAAKQRRYWEKKALEKVQK